MNRTLRYCINGSFLGIWFGVLLLSPNLAFAKFGFSGGGHDVPTPFEFVNSKFELADGEIYQLKGNIVFEKEYVYRETYGKPYLEVDLSYTPWLATKSRTRFPFYALDETYPWRNLEGKKVILLVRAHGKIDFDSAGKPSYYLTLGVLHQMR